MFDVLISGGRVIDGVTIVGLEGKNERCNALGEYGFQRVLYFRRGQKIPVAVVFSPGIPDHDPIFENLR